MKNIKVLISIVCVVAISVLVLFLAGRGPFSGENDFIQEDDFIGGDNQDIIVDRENANFYISYIFFADSGDSIDNTEEIRQIALIMQESLVDGMDFDAVSLEHVAAFDRNILLDTLNVPAETIETIRAELLRHSVGATSNVIETEHGFYIIKIEDMVFN